MSKKERFSPKPMRGETVLGAALLALEGQTCRCQRIDRDGTALPSCKHVVAILLSWQGNLTLDEWGQMLSRYDPSGYDGPPLSKQCDTAVTHAARQALYVERADHQCALRHPNDIGPGDVDGVKIQAGKGLIQLGLSAYDAEAPEPKDIDGLSLAELWMCDGASAADVLACWQEARKAKERTEMTGQWEEKRRAQA